MVVVGIFAVVVSIFVNGFVWGIWLDLFGFVLNYVLDCERRPWLWVGGQGLTQAEGKGGPGPPWVQKFFFFSI